MRSPTATTTEWVSASTSASTSASCASPLCSTPLPTANADEGVVYLVGLLWRVFSSFESYQYLRLMIVVTDGTCLFIFSRSSDSLSSGYDSCYCICVCACTCSSFSNRHECECRLDYGIGHSNLACLTANSVAVLTRSLKITNSL